LDFLEGGNLVEEKLGNLEERNCFLLEDFRASQSFGGVISGRRECKSFLFTSLL